MMFSRQHYEAIAAVIRESAGDGRRIERNLACMFAADNPRFNQERFAEACAPSRSVVRRLAVQRPGNELANEK